MPRKRELNLQKTPETKTVNKCYVLAKGFKRSRILEERTHSLEPVESYECLQLTDLKDTALL